MCDDSDIERARRALGVRCNMLARQVCKLFYSGQSCSRYCYSCNLWFQHTHKVYNAPRIQYNNGVLLVLPRFCSAPDMFADACAITPFSTPSYAHNCIPDESRPLKCQQQNAGRCGRPFLFLFQHHSTVGFKTPTCRPACDSI